MRAHRDVGLGGSPWIVRAAVVLACVAFSCGHDDDESPGGGGGSGGGKAGASASAGKSADAGPGSSGSGGGGGSAAGSLCARGCVETLKANCPMGPPSREVCESDCERLRAGECGAEYQALMACADGETLECDSRGLPVIPACDDEYQTFVSCVSP